MKLILILIVMLYSQQSIAQCQIDHTTLRADYQLTFYSDKHMTRQSELILWRQGDTVAHQYPQTHITETWYLSKNQQIKPTRYFDEYQRAIEYQPGEQVHGKSERDWLYRYQLVSENLLAQMTLKQESGSGCERQQVFVHHSTNSSIELTWLPEQQLLSHFRWQKAEVSEEWQLVAQNHDEKTIKTFFNKLDQYKSTDYADIGDDHSDPFLTKMVTLGFVEHGASGFYDTQGKLLDGHDH